MVALLAASLAITALMTYEAQDAAREQKALAFRAIRAETAGAAERFAAAAQLAEARGARHPFVTAWSAGPLLRALPSDPLPAAPPNDSAVSIRVLEGGREIWRSEPQYAGEFRASVGGPGGPLLVEATLRPGVADRLLAERMPTCRLALLLPLLGANVLLLGMAVRRLRREREAARLRSELVSGVSHELRTPLAQIRMFAETMLLGRMERAEDRQRALGIIVKEAARLTALIESILHFTRVERHAMPTRLEAVQPGALVEEIVDEYRPLARTRGVAVATELDAGLQHAAAEVDRGAVRQILLNLLDNAVKYGEGGEVMVRADAIGGRLRVLVDDRGPGIPAGERQRVWDPFYRLERDRRGTTAGSGIGLAVVRRLAQAQGGAAWLEGSPLGGARAVVVLGKVTAA
ncbi:MAG: sensor histidine kinase [Gemmatimonadales bacterium]